MIVSFLTPQNTDFFWPECHLHTRFLPCEVPSLVGSILPYPFWGGVQRPEYQPAPGKNAHLRPVLCPDFPRFACFRSAWLRLRRPLRRAAGSPLWGAPSDNLFTISGLRQGLSRIRLTKWSDVGREFVILYLLYLNMYLYTSNKYIFMNLFLFMCMFIYIYVQYFFAILLDSELKLDPRGPTRNLFPGLSLFPDTPG